MPCFRPDDPARAAEMVRSAAAEGTTLEIVGGGSKRFYGCPAGADHVLDLAALSGRVDYDPPELVISALAATPLAGIEQTLAAHRQMLAFEPPGWHALGGAAGAPTLGGVIACNLSGPRRVRAGAARDHLLGFAAINGFGDAWKAGGRVVKNVSGYDMCKLHCGALGTLSVLTELTLRTVPLPEAVCTVVCPTLDAAAAVRLMARALNAPFEVSAAAYLPPGRGLPAIAAGGVVALRLEGHAPSVTDRCARVAALAGGAEMLDDAPSRVFWREIGEVAPVLPPAGRCVWRLCPTPSAAPEVLARIGARLGSAAWYLDWGGGLIWLTLDQSEAGADGGAAVVRGALGPGHATLVLAPDAVRRAAPVFQPAPASLAALAARVKASFDPRHVLNPGRLGG